MNNLSLLDAYRTSNVYPKLGVGVRLNVRALRRIEELCDIRYSECVSIVMRGFVRIHNSDILKEDTTSVDVRVILLNIEGEEIINNYTLVCNYQPLQRSFEVMTIK